MHIGVRAAWSGMLALCLGPASVALAQPDAPSPTLGTVLTAVARYVGEYRGELSGLVGEELYRQQASTLINTLRFVDRRTQSRELRSDFLLVRPAGTDRLVEYRDVFEVDGQPVRDREGRLTTLFLQSGRSAESQAVAISMESARHNVGTITRTLNTPTLVLQLLLPDVQGGVRFTRSDDRDPDIDLEDGDWNRTEDIWTVAFAETGPDTLVRGLRDAPLPATGRFWIDPATGAVLASELVVDGPDVRGTVDVRYVVDAEVGARVPAEMRERYQDRYGSRAEGTATYTNFRRFVVEVSEAAPDR